VPYVDPASEKSGGQLTPWALDPVAPRPLLSRELNTVHGCVLCVDSVTQSASGAVYNTFHDCHAVVVGVVLLFL